jgi:hypothetical protein
MRYPLLSSITRPNDARAKQLPTIRHRSVNQLTVTTLRPNAKDSITPFREKAIYRLITKVIPDPIKNKRREPSLRPVSLHSRSHILAMSEKRSDLRHGVFKVAALQFWIYLDLTSPVRRG